MIFVTVGTHEDGFDRLLTEMDRLVATGVVTEEVVYQAGYSQVKPRRGRVEALLPFDEVQRLMGAARIVVTHGGPASIMQALAHGKLPIVVPRQARFGEHVDDHQVRFAQRIADRVVVVIDIQQLGAALVNHAERAESLAASGRGPDRARAFARRFDQLCDELVQSGIRGPAVLRWQR